MDSWVIQTIAVLATAGLSGAVAAGTWYWASKATDKLRHDARLTERKRGLYLEMVKLFADVMADAKNPKSPKSRPLNLALQYLTSSEFRLKQLELNMIAPDEVVRQLSWHGTSGQLDEKQQGHQAMLNVASMLLAIRGDMYGKTKLDEVDMWRIFLDAESAELLRSQFAELADTQAEHVRE